MVSADFSMTLTGIISIFATIPSPDEPLRITILLLITSLATNKMAVIRKPITSAFPEKEVSISFFSDSANITVGMVAARSNRLVLQNGFLMSAHTCFLYKKSTANSVATWSNTLKNRVLSVMPNML